jgi:hypothetical protein
MHGHYLSECTYNGRDIHEFHLDQPQKLQIVLDPALEELYLVEDLMGDHLDLGHRHQEDQMEADQVQNYLEGQQMETLPDHQIVGIQGFEL